MAKGSNANRALLKALAYVAGYIPESNTPTAVLRQMVERARARMGNEHSIPNQDSEILDFILFHAGLDPNERQNAMDELMPLEQLATIAQASVETVKENRAQVREARRAKGLFSKEARAARQDLRQDRRSSRRLSMGGSGARAIGGFSGSFLKGLFE